MVLAIAAVWALHQRRSDNQKATDDQPSEAQRSWQDQLPTFEIVRDNLLRCYPTPPPNNMTDLEYMKQPQVPVSSPSLTVSSTNTTSELEGVFRSGVRNEWINAVFGKDFFASPDYQAPRQGVGLSQIPSYVTYSVDISPAVDNKDSEDDSVDKFGLTLSRIAIGLYVRRVQQGSEAFLAGVKENSILVSINGMAVLAEPAKQALERIWQYEGYVWGENVTEEERAPGLSSSTSSISLEPNLPPCTTPSIKEPVTVTLIRDGKMYSVLFLSNPPYGITWGPCGNFALVQRVYSHAAVAGVRRGSLVASVNGLSLRTLDHAGTAEILRDLHSARRDIHMVLCYTPSAARTGHFESKSKAAGQKKKPKIAAIRDGVEVRIHPLECSITSLWKRSPAPAPRASCHVNTEEMARKRGNLGELASRVAAGEELAPIGRGSWIPHREYGPCPPLPKEKLLYQWDMLTALRYCISLHNAEYIECNVKPEDCENDITQLIESNSQGCKTGDTVGMFLPQLISAMCVGNLPEQHTEEKKERGADDEQEDLKQMFDQVTACMLRASRRDENLGQSLYFMLRSYIATFESYGSYTVERHCMSPTRNLFALLHCLDLIRSAEQQLVDQTSLAPVRSSSSSDKSGALTSDPSNENTEELRAGEAPASCAGVLVSNNDAQHFRRPESEAFTKKKKSVIRLFRKKSSKAKQISATAATHLNDGYLNGGTGNFNNSESTVRIPHFDSMSNFLDELDTICETIADSLLKSFSQKIADWALQPWSESKGNALTKVTDTMRVALSKMNHNPSRLPLINPVDSLEVLLAVDCKECFILPSAHFPLLLAFNVDSAKGRSEAAKAPQQAGVSVMRDEKLYRTRVEIVAVRGSPRKSVKSMSSAEDRFSFLVHGAVAGIVKESSRSTSSDGSSKSHVWDDGDALIFDTRSCWGAPQTLSLRLSSVAFSEAGHDQFSLSDESESLHYTSDVGFCWVDLRPVWHRATVNQDTMTPCHATATCHAQLWSFDAVGDFDENGEVPEASVSERLEIEIRVTAELLSFLDQAKGPRCPKRLLLYKHDDDLRQEMFAIQFISSCDKLLQASGLDLKLLTFRCIPVGPRRGFIEWIPGSVPLSDICQPFAGWLLDDNGDQHVNDDASLQSVSGVAKAGLTKYKCLRRLGGNQTTDARGSFANNPIQDYLRSVAYDPEAPYLIQTDVIGNYIKSCAGYCVITYLLGVGDRHLDNLLLHHTGRFFHCDYSFILGNDPKKYLPVRITEDMIFGMGGRGSDNYAKFLSLTGATFLALRQPGNVCFLLSLVRSMVPSCLPDLASAPEDVILSIRGRLRLDLSEHAAVSFMEKLIETSLSSKMWLAVDAIHSLGKKF